MCQSLTPRFRQAACEICKTLSTLNNIIAYDLSARQWKWECADDWIRSCPVDNIVTTSQFFFAQNGIVYLLVKIQRHWSLDVSHMHMSMPSQQAPPHKGRVVLRLVWTDTWNLYRATANIGNETNQSEHDSFHFMPTTISLDTHVLLVLSYLVSGHVLPSTGVWTYMKGVVWLHSARSSTPLCLGQSLIDFRLLIAADKLIRMSPLVSIFSWDGNASKLKEIRHLKIKPTDTVQSLVADFPHEGSIEVRYRSFILASGAKV